MGVERAGTGRSDRTIGRLVDRYKSGDRTDRLRVLEFLSTVTREERTVDLVLQAIRDREPAIRVQAIKTLAAHDPSLFLPITIPLLRDIDPRVRQQAVSSIGALKSTRTLVSLLRSLDDEYPWVRWAAIDAVRAFRDERVTNAVIPLLHDELPIVRRRAAEAIALDLRPIPVDELLDALKDEDRWVRFWAVEGLRASQNERAYGGLVLCLHDPEPIIYELAVRALGALGAVGALPHLEKLREERPELRGAIELAISRIHEAEGQRRAARRKLFSPVHTAPLYPPKSLSGNGERTNGQPSPTETSDFQTPVPGSEKPKPADESGFVIPDRNGILRLIGRIMSIGMG